MNLINNKITLKWESKGYVIKEIERLFTNRVESFYSEILPDELPNNLPIHLFDYFCKSFKPIEEIKFQVEYSSDCKGKRIIIYDGDKESFGCKYLLEIDVIESKKINNLEDLINISKNYEIVFLDCENPIVNIFGIEYNKQIKEKFYYLNSIILSPLRYKTNYWRSFLIELSKVSIREIFFRLININSTNEYKSKKTDLYYKYEFDDIYQNHDLILPWFTKKNQEKNRSRITKFHYSDFSDIYFSKINFKSEDNNKDLQFSDIINKYSFILESEKIKNKYFWEFCFSQSIKITSRTIEDYRAFISIVKNSNLNVDIKNYLLEIILRSLVESDTSLSYKDKIAIASNWEEGDHVNSYSHFMRVLRKDFSLKRLDSILNKNSKDSPFNFENEYIRLINLFYNEDELKDVPKFLEEKGLLYNHLLGFIQKEGQSIYNVLYSESFFLKHGKSLKKKLEDRLSNIDISNFYSYDIGLILLLFGCKEINAKDFIKISMLPDAIPNLKFSGRTHIIDEFIHDLDINEILNIHLRILTILKFYQLDEQHDIFLKKLNETGKLNESNLYWRQVYSESTSLKGYNFTDFLLKDPYLTTLCHFSKHISNHNKNLICHQ